MTSYPLVFGLRNIFAGNGFVAGVAVDGRALLVNEEDGYWIYGVNPGGIAAGGRNEADAISAFRETYQSVVVDIALETTNFEEFKAQVEELVNTTNQPMEADWLSAVVEVREGRVSSDWLKLIPVDSAKVGVTVDLLTNPRPSANALPTEEARMAA